MAEPPEPHRPESAARDARPAYLVALFVAVTWAAAVFAADGLIAVIADRDPVPGGVSPYYSLLAILVAGLVVWIVCARAPLAASPVLPGLVAGAVVYLVTVASGLVGEGLRLMIVQATSPFTLCAAAGALLAVVGMWLGLRAWRAREHRPTP